MAVVALVIATSFVAARTLVGHWKVAYGNNMTGDVVFRKDGTLEATFDGQTWKIGGTWAVNRYPNLACDVPSHVYSLSTDLNPGATAGRSPRLPS